MVKKVVSHFSRVSRLFRIKNDFLVLEQKIFENLLRQRCSLRLRINYQKSDLNFSECGNPGQACHDECRDTFEHEKEECGDDRECQKNAQEKNHECHNGQSKILLILTSKYYFGKIPI